MISFLAFLVGPPRRRIQSWLFARYWAQFFSDWRLLTALRTIVQARNATSPEKRHMTSATPSVMDTRCDQMFPALQPFEIERGRRFGEVRSFGVGEPLAKVGDVGRGFGIILAGQVDVTRYDSSATRFTELDRTSPMANTPGTFVSNGRLAPSASNG